MCARVRTRFAVLHMPDQLNIKFPRPTSGLVIGSQDKVARKCSHPATWCAQESTRPGRLRWACQNVASIGRLGGARARDSTTKLNRKRLRAPPRQPGRPKGGAALGLQTAVQVEFQSCIACQDREGQKAFWASFEEGVSRMVSRLCRTRLTAWNPRDIGLRRLQAVPAIHRKEPKLKSQKGYFIGLNESSNLISVSRCQKEGFTVTGPARPGTRKT